MRRILLIRVCVYEELLLFQPKIETNTFCRLLVYGERFTLGQKCYKNPLMIHNNISLPPIKSVDIFFFIKLNQRFYIYLLVTRLLEFHTVIKYQSFTQR